ncbi:polysaccharide biosynthesis tyrosine autokinase [Candidatus Saccharibacteria bacterium]|nr:polysaccharide biosynthesis tyrosine autokinase [Candidatus Saccharibacteria bacterium]
MEEINIKDFFIYLKRYIWAFVLMILLCVGGILTYDLAFKKPVYQAQTTIVIAKSDNANNAAATLNDVNASQKLTSTYGEIAKSELVLNQVVDNLELGVSAKDLGKNLTVKPVEDTSILSVTVKDLNAEKAATIANEVADVFSEEVSKIYKLDNVSQLSVAKTPTSPSNNTLTRDVILGTVVAVALVTGFAFLRFYLDDTVKHGDEVEKIYGLPKTGRICKSDMKASKKGEVVSELVVEKYPKSIVSENIKSLRTNLQFTAVDKNLKTILVTSTNASEGKSFVSANLAISFAQAEKKVLLIDCDLRKGRVHRLFDVPNTDGLSNLLTDDLENLNHYIHNTSIDNLDIITCGTYPPNPSELLASKKNKRLLTSLRHRYDIIIFDGAPIGGLADSVILSSLMDETVIVVKDGNTSKSDLMAAKTELEKVGAKVAGIVFNMVDRKSSRYYSYYYGHGYGYGESKNPKK